MSVRVADDDTVRSPAGLDFLDIRGITVAEETDGVHFSMDVSQLPTSTGGTGAEDTLYYIVFEAKGQLYAVQTYFSEIWQVGSPLTFLVANPSPETGATAGDSRGRLNLTIEGTSWTAVVPHELLLDSTGAPLLVGDDIVIVRARSILIANEWFSMPVRARDYVPDGDFLGETLALKFAPAPDGTMILFSSQTTRYSNGGSGAMLFDITARNLGSGDLDLFLRSNDVPPGWDVSLPRTNFVLPAHSDVPFQILVTTQSGHQHRGEESFSLVASTPDDPTSLAKLPLTIHYLDTPQPAGHHSRIYLHHATTGSFIFNAVEDYEGAQSTPMRSSGFGIDNQQQANGEWRFQLEPRLQLGLSLDGGAATPFSIPLHFGQPTSEFTVRGTLLLTTPDRDIPLMALSPMTFTDVSPGQTVSYEGTVRVDTSQTEIPFQSGTNLVLSLEWEGSAPPAPSPGGYEILPGGFLDLPLFDYYDEIAQGYGTQTGLMMDASSPDIFINPGKIAVVPIHVENLNGQEIDLRFSLSGGGGLWAYVTPDHILIPPGGRTDVSFVMEPPAELDEGTSYEWFLHAVGAMGETLGALRLSATYDPAVLVEDQSDAIPMMPHESPGSGLMPFLLATLAIILLRRNNARP